MALKNFCTKCRKLAKLVEFDLSAGTHMRGFGCRKDEPLLVVDKVPTPDVKVITFEKAKVATVHTGPINSLAAALLKSGLVKVQAHP